MDITANLERLLASGKDSASLRFALGSRYLEIGDSSRALEHARAAVELDPEYSAAWKLLGKAEAAAGRAREARQAYVRGIEVAERRGDRQAAKEMAVFLKRLERAK
jgi:Tfp pilus assembly protein PilF